MSLRKDIERTVKLKEFHKSVEQLLTLEDRDYLFYAMKEYNTYRSVAKLMLALNSCLDTPEKLDLLLYIRELIPKQDQRKFDTLAPYNRMAHPASPKKESKGQRNESNASISPDVIRTLTLHRPKGVTLGFSIRGGREHNLGIYVSHVDSLSLAERCGLLVGDQIISVNGISFESITHSSAVLVLKSHDDFSIMVKSIGRVPGQKISRNSFVWVDVTGNPIPNGRPRSTESVEGRAAGDRLLASTDRHKVVLRASKKDLGFSIRGGSEYSLGIYISCVDKGSPAEEGGLRVGDQILDVNGHSFINTFHQEAVTILRAYPTLILTLKSLGRLPALAIAKSSDSNERKTETSQGSSQPSVPKGLSLNRKSLSPMQEEISIHHSDLALNKPQSRVTQGLGQAKVKRTRSFQTSVTGPPNTYRRYRGYHSPSIAGPPPTHRSPKHDFRGIDLEQSSTPPRAKRAVGVSPLATKGSRAVSPLAATTASVRAHSASPRESIPEAVVSFRPRRVASDSSITEKKQQPDKRDPKFFEYGLGSQMMLSSATTVKARELMVDRARRLLSEAEVQTLLEKIRMYERNGQIGELVEFLMTMLNTPEKLQLLTDIRSLLHPSDLVQFDELVSPQEVEALHQRSSLQIDEDHAGQKALRHTSTDETNDPKPTELGAFGAPIAQSVLYKATSTDDSFRGMQTKESFLAWQDGHDRKEEEKEEIGITHQPPFSSNPVAIELPKTGPSIGLLIGGGIDTDTPEITIIEVKDGGAAHKDGFLKPGFEIVEVGGVRVKGKTHDEAARTLAQAYSTENPTIELIVIPN